MMTKLKKRLPAFCLILYCAVMVYLLFLQKAGRSSPLTYYESLSANLNIIPFANLYAYITAPIHSALYTKEVLVNIVGNVIIFIPAGIFLPFFLKKCRSFKTFLLVATLISAAIELIQLFSLLGMCDIDDVILNVLGSIIGFKIWGAKPMQRFCLDRDSM